LKAQGLISQRVKPKQNYLSPVISEATKLDLELIFRFFFPPTQRKE